MPFDLGPMELGLILLIVAMLFGVGKLPELFGSIGKGVREFRKEAGMDGSTSSEQPADPPASGAGSPGSRHRNQYRYEPVVGQLSSLPPHSKDALDVRTGVHQGHPLFFCRMSAGSRCCVQLRHSLPARPPLTPSSASSRHSPRARSGRGA